MRARSLTCTSRPVGHRLSGDEAGLGDAITGINRADSASGILGEHSARPAPDSSDGLAGAFRFGNAQVDACVDGACSMIPRVGALWAWYFTQSGREEIPIRS